MGCDRFGCGCLQREHSLVIASVSRYMIGFRAEFI
jgi:hypothetical protein